MSSQSKRIKKSKKNFYKNRNNIKKANKNNSRKLSNGANTNNIKIKTSNGKNVKEKLKSYTVYNTMTQYSPLYKYKNMLKIITNIVLAFILILVIFSMVILSVDNSNISSSFLGYKFFQVNTTSMYPDYKPNDLLIVKQVDESNINVDDVIIFYQNNNSQIYLIRRVIEKIDNYQETGYTGFRTKPDADYSENLSIINPNQISGVVKFKIMGLGVLIKIINENTLFISSIIVLLTILCLLIRLLFELNGKASNL